MKKYIKEERELEHIVKLEKAEKDNGEWSCWNIILQFAETSTC